MFLETRFAQFFLANSGGDANAKLPAGDPVVDQVQTTGKPLPASFSEDLKQATFERFRTDLKEVSGAKDFIQRFSHLPRCIASSSSIDRLELCISLLALEREFGLIIYCPADLDEDFVYDLTKLYDNNRGMFFNQSLHMAWDPGRVARTNPPLDLHPGAERYYREVGIL